MHTPFQTGRATRAGVRHPLPDDSPTIVGDPRERERPMPVYEYRCPACAATYEKLVRLSEPNDEAACPTCGGPGKKLLSLFASVARSGAEGQAPAPVGGAGGGGGCCGGGSCAG